MEVFIRTYNFQTDSFILSLQYEWKKLSRNHLLLTVNWGNESSGKINAI